MVATFFPFMRDPIPPFVPPRREALYARPGAEMGEDKNCVIM